MQALSAEAVSAALRTRRLGHPVIFFERVGSTNDLARELAAAGAPEGLLVLADEQTAGRGRMGRLWWAPAGSSLLMSLLLRPPLPPAQAGQTMMALALGALEGVEAVTGLRPVLKWPNDLLLEGSKLGGMLAEIRTDGDRLDYVILGLGLNVNVDWTAQTAIPAGIAAVAASLSATLGQPVDRLGLLVEILARCEAWYDRLLAAQAGRPGGEPIHIAWAARLETLGRRVSVAAPDGTVTGTAVGVTAEGALQVRREDGTLQIVWSGDVV